MGIALQEAMMKALAALLILYAQDADIPSLIRDLDHAEYDVRRKAFRGLVKSGKAALSALREAVRDTTSAEVRDSAPRAVEAILLSIRQEFIADQTTDPRKLRCGGVTFDTGRFSADRVKELSAWFPDCEFLRGWFSCMHRVQFCSGEWIVGLSHRDGEIFTVRKEKGRREGFELGSPDVLARRHKPVQNREGAVALARLLTEIREAPTVSEVDGGWRVTWPKAVVTFDAAGRLVKFTCP
jgi:hypothetical protein